ncbi:MAG: hypothetical protein JNK57_15735 [Planctomycetaceae bacterium]|nr:hypothetical protein [Planctomycetaceae bacterium]
MSNRDDHRLGNQIPDVNSFSELGRQDQIATAVLVSLPASPSSIASDFGGSVQPPPFPITNHVDVDSAGVVTALFAENRFENFLLRVVGGVQSGFRWVGGMFGVGFLLAWLATVPIVQFLTLGYFVEVTRRVAKSGRLRDGLLGATEGWLVCKWMFGLAVTWLPLLAVSRMRYDAWLVDPLSTTYASWRFWEFVVFGLTVVHWIGVGLTGGQLRHFFWPLLVPWYMMTGLVKRGLSISWVQLLVEKTIGSILPKTVAAYYRSVPLSNWFVPAVLWRHLWQGTLLSESSDRFWNWVARLRPGYYFSWGFGAFAGMLMWFVGPTLWLLIATRATNPAAEGIFFLLGLGHLFLSLQYYPLVHCRYCETGRWRSYWQWRQAACRYWYSPLRLCLAAALALVLTFPLWLTRIAMIPYELWWLLSVAYVVLLGPVWLTWGWAWHHAANKPRSTTWLWGLSWMPIFWALIFGQVIMTVVSIYTSWQGVFNILLHPTFNVPSPFSLNA